MSTKRKSAASFIKPPTPTMVQFSVRMSEAMHAKAVSGALASGCTLNMFVTAALAKFLAEMKAEKRK